MSSYKRVANSQKCIRIGGKHNDLEDVGLDLTHHTFFEMLGSWSFGDYFKREACGMALELLIDVYKIPMSSLYFTYFKGDNSLQLQADLETRDIWMSLGVNENRVLPCGMKDNFWDMGHTGPCGPCTEIHYDHHHRTRHRGVPHLVNTDNSDVVEIWNLVFMQYNRQADQTLMPLPWHHVDTGLGLERLTAVLQNTTSNYHTDLFRPIFDAIHKDYGIPPYQGNVGQEDIGGRDRAYRVVADHIRMLSVCLSEGILPDRADQHGHKVRAVLYRCLQSAKVLGLNPGYISSLVDIVVESLGATYPELSQSSKRVKEVIDSAEDHYYKTLEQGTKAFNKFLRKRKKTGPINETEANDLLSGRYVNPVPMEILESLAHQHNLSISLPKRGLEEHTDKQEGKGHIISCLEDLPRTDDQHKYSYKWTGTAYDFPDVPDATVVGVNSDHSDESMKSGEKGSIFLDKTCFYGESGGQLGDTGTLENETSLFVVTDTKVQGETVQHIGFVEKGEIKKGDSLTARINQDRRLSNMRAHTATHLLNWSLRQLTNDARQNGSKVGEDRLYFEVFTAKEMDTVSDVVYLQDAVRGVVTRALPVTRRSLPLSQAQALDHVVYLLNETYPHTVNIISIEDDGIPLSVELCGGTHVVNTADIGDFCIEKLKGVGQGRKCVYCYTGELATQAQRNGDTLVGLIEELELALKTNSRLEEWETLTKTIKTMLSKDILPKLEREDVETRLNQIEHVVTTRLNAINLQRLKKEILLAQRKTPRWVQLSITYGNYNVIKKALSTADISKPVIIIKPDSRSTQICIAFPKGCDAELKRQILEVFSDHGAKVKEQRSKVGELYSLRLEDMVQGEQIQWALSTLFYKDLHSTIKY
ncbi:alanine--tRNA ligase, cytoplasmic-like isoform X2 [Crassostrea virginica]